MLASDSSLLIAAVTHTVVDAVGFAKKRREPSAPSSLAKPPASVDLEAIANLLADRRGKTRAGPY